MTNPDHNRLVIALDIANANVNMLIRNLADAQARIESLEAQIKAALEPKKAE